jgi:DNA primase catalytic core
MTTDRLSGRKTLKVAGFLEEFEKDEIKSRVDIVALFSHFGVKLTTKGRGFSGICPWHQDKDPSLSVDREKGLYHCFGCGESGDAFALVEKMKGVGFREALEYLRRHAGRMAAPRPPARPAAQEAEAAPGASTEDDHPEITLSTVVEHYHKRFCESSQARGYLEKRGITSLELMKRFKIGYADGSILSMISNGQKGRLKSLGLLTETGRELFRGSLTFPILDEAGCSTGLYARSIDERSKLKHLYLPGRHHGVFNRGASKAFGEIILTEGIIDALSLIQVGLENVQACYGAGGFTDEHLEVLKTDRVKTVIVAFDNDSPGRKASEELAARLASEGFSVKRIFPQAKDWNEDLLAGMKAPAVK